MYCFLSIAKKGFFGRTMLIATNEKYNLEISGRRQSFMLSRNASTPSVTMERRLSFSGLIASNNRVNHFVRFIYFLNAAIILAGLAYIASEQHGGAYRASSINVIFNEEIWENARVQVGDDDIEKRLLVYSSFNGIYKGEMMIWIYFT